eukprot:7380814-Prymnesium_polylepis.1
MPAARRGSSDASTRCWLSLSRARAHTVVIVRRRHINACIVKTSGTDERTCARGDERCDHILQVGWELVGSTIREEPGDSRPAEPTEEGPKRLARPDVEVDVDEDQQRNRPEQVDKVPRHQLRHSRRRDLPGQRQDRRVVERPVTAPQLPAEAHEDRHQHRLKHAVDHARRSVDKRALGQFECAPDNLAAGKVDEQRSDELRPDMAERLPTVADVIPYERRPRADTKRDKHDLEVGYPQRLATLHRDNERRCYQRRTKHVVIGAVVRHYGRQHTDALERQNLPEPAVRQRALQQLVAHVQSRRRVANVAVRHCVTQGREVGEA